MMEKNNFKINEVIDFNDIPLKIDEEVINNSQKRISIKPNDRSYKSIIQKSIQEQEIFKNILEKIEPIDFLLESTGSIGKDLRNELKNTTDLRSREILERKIEKLIPNNKQKYVIIIRHLLELTEKLGYGMGIYNDDFYYFDGRYWVKKDKNILIAFLGEFAEKAG